jgi:cell wall-associated NlpC family hydrolase
MSLLGIQYVNDNSGNPIKAVVDIRLHANEFAAFLQQVAAKERAQTNKNSSNSLFGGGGITPPNNQNNNASKVNQLLNEARKYIGTPYRTGGTTTSGMDCSGFTMMAFKSIGVNLPRVSGDQTAVGQAIAKNQLQAGDLLFFATTTPNRINHVGIVASVESNGNVKFLHASSSRGVMEANMSLDYWQKAYMTARRIIS